MGKIDAVEVPVFVIVNTVYPDHIISDPLLVQLVDIAEQEYLVFLTKFLQHGEAVGGHFQKNSIPDIQYYLAGRRFGYRHADLIEELVGVHSARFIQLKYAGSDQFFAGLFVSAPHQLLQVAFDGWQVEVEQDVSEVENDIFYHGTI